MFRRRRDGGVSVALPLAALMVVGGLVSLGILRRR